MGALSMKLGAQARRSALLDLHAKIDPDVVLLELFPFGRRQFAFELLPLLEAIHAAENRSLVACSVRDVLVASKTTKPRGGGRRKGKALLRRRLRARRSGAHPVRRDVHREPSKSPTSSSTPATLPLCTDNATSTEGKDEVLVSAGGGAVGAPLLLDSARGAPADAARRTHVAPPDRTELSRRRFRAAFGASRREHDRRAVPQRFPGAAAQLPRFRFRKPATTPRWISCSPASAPSWSPIRRRAKRNNAFAPSFSPIGGCLRSFPNPSFLLPVSPKAWQMNCRGRPSSDASTFPAPTRPRGWFIASRPGGPLRRR